MTDRKMRMIKRGWQNEAGKFWVTKSVVNYVRVQFDLRGFAKANKLAGSL